MAKFNYDVQDQPPQNFDYIMKMPSYAADTSKGTLLEGLTQAFKNIVTGTDEVIKESVGNTIHKGYDQLQNDFGIYQAADQLSADTRGMNNGPVNGLAAARTGAGQTVGASPTGDVPVPEGGGTSSAGGAAKTSDVVPSAPSAPVPAGVQSATSQAGTLASAYKMGGIPEAYYWARMNSLLRSVKAQYPGYQDYIQEKFSTITGEQSANHLRQQLLDKMGAESPDEKELRELEKHATQNGDLPMDYWQRRNSGSPYTLAELGDRIASRSRDRKDIEDGRARIGAVKDNQQLVKENALESYRTELKVAVKQGMTDMTSQGAIGPVWKQLNDKLADIQKRQGSGNPSISGPEGAQIGSLLSQLETQIQMNFSQIGTKSLGLSDNPAASYSTLLKPEEMKAAREEAMSLVSVMKEALAGKDALPLLSAAKTYLDNQNNTAAVNLTKNIPSLQVIGALTKVMGGQGAATLIATIPNLSDTVIKQFVEADWGTAFLDPEQGQRDPNKSLTGDMKKFHDDPDHTPTQSKIYNGAMFKSWDNTTKKIVSGEVGGPAAKAAMTYMYGPANYGMLATMEPSSRRQAFMQLTGPQAFAAAKKLRDGGDMQSWQTYHAFVVNGFQALARADINSLKGFNASGTGHAIVYDPKQNAFVDTKNSQPGDKAGQYFGAAAATEVPGQIDKLNKLIQTIAPVLKEEGMDPAMELNKFFTAMGLHAEAGPTSGTVAHQLAQAVQNPQQEGPPGPFEKGPSAPAAQGPAAPAGVPLPPQKPSKLAAAQERLNSIPLREFKQLPHDEQLAHFNDSVHPPAPPDKPVSLASLGVNDETGSMGVGYRWGTQRDVSAIIVHHTGGNDTVGSVERTLKQRNLGAQFFIDRGGRIHQLLPDQAVGRQILPGWGTTGQGLSNRNTIGIEVAGRGDKDINPQQIEAGKKLVEALQTKYGLDRSRVFGHGEVNPGHKEKDEGMTITNYVRTGQAPKSIADLHKPQGLEIAPVASNE